MQLINLKQQYRFTAEDDVECRYEFLYSFQIVSKHYPKLPMMLGPDYMARFNMINRRYSYLTMSPVLLESMHNRLLKTMANNKMKSMVLVIPGSVLVGINMGVEYQLSLLYYFGLVVFILALCISAYHEMNRNSYNNVFFEFIYSPYLLPVRGLSYCFPHSKHEYMDMQKIIEKQKYTYIQ